MTLETLAGDRFLHEAIGVKRSRSPWSLGRRWKRAARDVILEGRHSRRVLQSRGRRSVYCATSGKPEAAVLARRPRYSEQSGHLDSALRTTVLRPAFRLPGLAP